MTTYDLLFDAKSAAPQRPGALAWLKRQWMNDRRRRRERQTIHELSRLDAHLLRDMGIEPQDVYDALTGRTRSILMSPLRRADRSE